MITEARFARFSIQNRRFFSARLRFRYALDAPFRCIPTLHLQAVPNRTTPALSPVSPKALLFPLLLNKAQNKRRKGCERGTTRNFLHSFPLSSTLVVQSCWAWRGRILLRCLRGIAPLGGYVYRKRLDRQPRASGLLKGRCEKSRRPARK